MSIGLLSFIIKRANHPNDIPGSVLGNTLFGSLLGGTTGALGGAVGGYLSTPDEIDEYTGQPKSKLSGAWDGAKQYGLIGAGIGGLTGAATGWNQKGQNLDWAKQNFPTKHDEFLKNWSMPNMTRDLSEYNK